MPGLQVWTSWAQILHNSFLQCFILSVVKEIFYSTGDTTRDELNDLFFKNSMAMPKRTRAIADCQKQLVPKWALDTCGVRGFLQGADWWCSPWRRHGVLGLLSLHWSTRSPHGCLREHQMSPNQGDSLSWASLLAPSLPAWEALLHARRTVILFLCWCVFVGSGDIETWDLAGGRRWVM